MLNISFSPLAVFYLLIMAQKLPFFDDLLEEITQIILSHVMTFNRPIKVSYLVSDSVNALSPLLVCKRFHRIAEKLLYRRNTFEFGEFYTEFFFHTFLSSLSQIQTNLLTMLRLYYLPNMYSFSSFTALIASCQNLKCLGVMQFPKRVTTWQLRKFANLPVQDIWFGNPLSSRLREALESLIVYSCCGSRLITERPRVLQVSILN